VQLSRGEVRDGVADGKSPSIFAEARRRILVVGTNVIIRTTTTTTTTDWSEFLQKGSG
jgi:hypothetical protein